MTALRVLHLSKIGGIAGSENHLIDLLPRLREFGIAPTMGVIAGPGDEPEVLLARMAAQGIPCEVLRARSDYDINLLTHVGRLLSGRRFDLLHTHLVHGDVYGLVANMVWGGLPAISSRHNDDPHWSQGVRGALLRAIIRRADHFIVISEFLRQWMNDLRIASPERCSVIHYGFVPREVPPEQPLRARFGIPADAPIIGMVARFCEQKGHATLLRAMALVRDQHPNARLVLVGFGPLEGELRQLVRELALEDRVIFTGQIRDAFGIMHQFDLFVHPSRWEGFGLVFLEAMMAGVPVIATRVSAIPEIVIDGQTGLLVPPDDPRAVALAMNELLADKLKARTLGERGRERVLRDFTPHRMAEQTAEVYRQIYEGNQRAQNQERD